MKPPVCRSQDWVMDPLNYYFYLSSEGKISKLAYDILLTEIEHYIFWLGDQKTMMEHIKALLEENAPK